MKKGYIIVGLIVLVGVIVMFVALRKEAVLVDTITPEKLTTVAQTADTFLVEWALDTMDRGDHDLFTSVHGKLVVSSNMSDLQRGMIVYYEVPSQFLKENPNLRSPTLGRVIGLPGETVEIKKGKVYIDDQRLATFYGEAIQFGMNKEQWYAREHEKKQTKEQEQQTKDYYNLAMPAITIEEGTIFVLVDAWWRGYDSRRFGLISVDAVRGIVLGYEEP
ncbi:signal peptidase I [Bacillus ndiopicus]|uniref:signal peptidase I n=1 Tax=Bacillus ndiopicus TaxID=1347368 RepID=UPI000693B8B6|nr:signal peptidase I [Bacillus ndiopicus]